MAKYDLKLKTLVGRGSEVSDEGFWKDLVRGVTKGADTELGWSTELEEANRSLDEAIGYLDLDYPDAAEKVRQNRRSRPKGVEAKGRGKGESDRQGPHQDSSKRACDKLRRHQGQRKRCGKGKEPSF